MRNQPFSQLDATWSDAGPAPDPRLRVLILGGLICSCMAGIALRVAYVQCILADRFIRPWQATHSEEQVIPSRDGRILSRDGVVLAQDEVRYDLAVEYRWLETPPNPEWLRKQAYRDLSSRERNHPEYRRAAEERIRLRREELLTNLAQAAHTDRQELSQTMASIQHRVESMLQAVEARRRKHEDTARNSAAWSWNLACLTQLIREELTTPPNRYSEDPVVLKEELQEHVLLRNVSLEVVALVQTQPTRFPGVRIQTVSTRTYPEQTLASHVIGLRRIPPTGAKQNDPDRRRGQFGVEAAQDALLAGQPGLLRETRDRRGEVLDSQLIRSPRDGADVVLTIDSRLQQVAEQLLDAALSPAVPAGAVTPPVPAGGALIAMDVWTGDVLAIASSPRPSLTMLSRPSAQEWDALLSDPRRPLFSRATQMALPAGSLFKVVTAVAALEEGRIAANDILQCQGYLDRPDRDRCLIFRRHGVGHGQVALNDALCQSCNVYFYQLARRLGAAELCDWADRFGFGRPTGMDLPGESAGALPRPDDPARREKWYPGTTLQLSIGQGALLVTPLQVVRMMGAIANGGYLVRPHIVSEISPAGELAGEGTPLPTVAQQIPGLHSGTLETIRQGLEMAVHDPRGTGRAARVASLTLAGKTGTAEVADSEDHAWFAGYAPAEQPRVAFVVVLEHGGSSSRAAPIIRDLLTEMLGLGYLRPDASEPLETGNNSAPRIDPVTQARDTEGDE